jgi:hypothetical protein
MKSRQFRFAALWLIVVPLSQLFSQWVQTSGPLQGAVQSLAVSGVTILAGTYSSGVYSSTNGGVDWIEANNGLKSPGQNASVLSLAVKGGLVFAGTDQLPLYRSADLGLHWDAVGTGLPNRSVQSIFVRGEEIYLGPYGGEIYLSTDNGATWKGAGSGVPSVNTVYAFGSSGQYVFAGTGGAGMFRSSNSGVSWKSINSGLPAASWIYSMLVVPNPSGSAVLYAGIEGDGMYASTDMGDTWKHVSSGFPQHGTINSIVVSAGSLFAGTRGDGVFVSTNNGAQWNAINSGLVDSTVRALILAPDRFGTTRLFSGTEGKGVFYYTADVSSSPSLAAICPTQGVQGTPFWLEVHVGDSKPVTGMYGVSFKLTSDHATCTYVDGSAASGDFLGTSPVSFSQKVDAQTIDIAISKIAAPGVSGKGLVAKAQYVSSSAGSVRFSVRDVQAVDAYGNVLSLDTLGATISFVSSLPVVQPAVIAPYEPGKPFWIELHVGDRTAVKNLYGISLKLKSSDAACTYVPGSGTVGSLLGGAPIAFFQAADPTTVDMSLSKTAAPGVNGSGVLAKVQFICSSNKQVRFSVLDVIAVDPTGAPVQFDTAGVCIVVSSGSTIAPAAVAQVQPRTPFWVDVRVGDLKAVTGLYGISFKLKSDQAQCSYVDGSAVAGTFLGTNPLSFMRTLDQQTVDMSVTRISTPGVSGSGVVGRAQFTCSNTGTVTFNITDVVAVDQNGAVLNMNPLSQTVTVTLTATGVTDQKTQPLAFALNQNYPNPFNPRTSITFSLPRSEFAILEVYSLLGKKVATLCSAVMSSGEHTVQWQPQDVPSGMYVYRLQAGEMQQFKKLVYLK